LLLLLSPYPSFVEELQSQHRAARDAEKGDCMKCAATIAMCLGELWLGVGLEENESTLLKNSWA